MFEPHDTDGIFKNLGVHFHSVLEHGFGGQGDLCSNPNLSYTSCVTVTLSLTYECFLITRYWSRYSAHEVILKVANDNVYKALLFVIIPQELICKTVGIITCHKINMFGPNLIFGSRLQYTPIVVCSFIFNFHLYSCQSASAAKIVDLSTTVDFYLACCWLLLLGLNHSFTIY